MPIKIITVVGVRPNFMKAAPIIAAVREKNAQLHSIDPTGSQANQSEWIEHILVHTGQHYDELMSNAFFADLHLPPPDLNLGVGSASHAVQTAEIMKRFEEIVLQERPDVVLVVGDVNSTLACALATAKVSFDVNGARPLIGHVEAGLRSFDRSMPEETNRILTDQLSDLLFVTEESGLRNLRQEGISNEKIHFVGNTMIDSLLALKDKVETSPILDKLGLREFAGNQRSTEGADHYVLMTLHRPSNVDDPERFRNILLGLDELSQSYPVIFPTHPRTRKKITQFALERFFVSRVGTQRHGGTVDVRSVRGIHLIDPLGYLDFLCLMKHAVLVITDSGGIQEETTCFRIPCVTVRENTERPVTVIYGTNTIAGTGTHSIRNAVKRQMERRVDSRLPEKWDGKAGVRILEAVALEFRRKRSTVAIASYAGKCFGQSP